jgi:hypothetical protein
VISISSLVPVVAVAVAVVLVIALLVVLLVVRRSRSRSRGGGQPADRGTRPSSPTAIACPFCRREYEPGEAGGRCPGCGAATPKR